MTVKQVNFDLNAYSFTFVCYIHANFVKIQENNSQ